MLEMPSHADWYFRTSTYMHGFSYSWVHKAYGFFLTKIFYSQNAHPEKNNKSNKCENFSNQKLDKQWFYLFLKFLTLENHIEV